MLDLLSALSQWLTPLWEMSVTAAYAAAVVIVLRLLLKKRAPKQVLCLLWLVVFARLLVPVSLESPLSIVPDAQQVQFAQDLPSKLSGGGQASSTQGQGPVQGYTPAQNQSPEQAGGVTADPASQGNASPNTVPVLTAPEGIPPAAPQPEAPASFPWQAVLAGVWLAGMAAMALYALVSYFRLHHCLFDAIRAEDGAWEHPAVNSPFILGVLRPKIYLPAGLTGQPRKFILCHERAHLRRLDHIVKPVCWAALVIHWFNPMVWCAYILMSRDIEAACDEAVIRRLGPHVKADYSATLLSLATNGRVPAPCPLAFDEGDAKGRIKNVLNYRRPALWIVVVSVLAAVLAAACLLTDPVAAKEPEGNPDADPSPSADPSQAPGADSDTLLDPWMKEILDGERSFSAGGDTKFNIHQLRTMVYGDDELPRLTLEVGQLTAIDLDRDGINEMVVWPTGEHDDPTEVGYYTGYFVFRRWGDTVRVYWPGWRSIGDLKADGTFDWSGSAFEWGTGSASFDVDGMFTISKITWCDNSIDAEHYFVDGRAAEKDAFDRAIYLRQYQPDPIWYTYTDGMLTRILPSIPLDYYALPPQLPIPDFLDEEQQLLYRQAYVLYTRLFGFTNDDADFFPGQGILEPAEDVRRGDWTYCPASGMFARWDDFERAVLSVFTRDSWDAKNSFDDDGNAIYINVDGRLYFLNYGRGGGNYNGYFPETFRLVEQTDDAISFIMTGYYSDDYPREGESYEDVNARNVAYWEYSIDFPMRMVKTENGWRFDEFHLAMTDDDSEFYSQRVPNLSPMSIADLAPLSAPLVTDPKDIPSDPTQWYKVAELPDDMIWLYTRDYGLFSGLTLIRWDGNFFKVFYHTAHTPHCIMPQLKKLGGADTYGPLAVISETGSGAGADVYELVVYDLDAEYAVDYFHDWKPLAEDFNKNHTFQYDNETRVMTLTYQGQTVTKTLDPVFVGDHDRIEQEGCSLSITGEQIHYSFDETNNGDFQLRLGAEFLIGGSWGGSLFPVDVAWTLRFNGSGFDVVPGSCVVT